VFPEHAPRRNGKNKRDEIWPFIVAERGGLERNAISSCCKINPECLCDGIIEYAHRIYISCYIRLMAVPVSVGYVTSSVGVAIIDSALIGELSPILLCDPTSRLDCAIQLGNLPKKIIS
jgi:hypothetical protein